VAFADPILSIHGKLTLNLLGFRVDVKKLSSNLSCRGFTSAACAASAMIPEGDRGPRGTGVRLLGGPGSGDRGQTFFLFFLLAVLVPAFVGPLSHF
jgi:hypothetical protein